MVIWTESARADLKHIYEFIANNSAYYAKKVTTTLRDKPSVLNELPAIGKIMPESGKPYLRELSVYSYRILYQTTDEHCYILAIIHKRQLLNPNDLPDPTSELH